MITKDISWLQKARREGYAIPAINTQGGNYDIIRAICKAAQECRSPIMLAHYINTGAYAGNDWFVQVAQWCAQRVDVPVFIHLDHGSTAAQCEEALDLGFTSIMIDGSSLPVCENAALTQQVVQQAHAAGVAVEAEVGELQRLDVESEAAANKNTASPEDVEEFLRLCAPDTLAVGIGNAHGYYHGKPDIRLDVLEQVAALTALPLVLHGCTGMEESLIKQAIALGVAKINFGTEVRYKYVQHLQTSLNTMDHQGHSWKISQNASDALVEDIKHIIALSGSAGKA